MHRFWAVKAMKEAGEREGSRPPAPTTRIQGLSPPGRYFVSCSCEFFAAVARSARQAAPQTSKPTQDGPFPACPPVTPFATACPSQPAQRCLHLPGDELERLQPATLPARGATRSIHPPSSPSAHLHVERPPRKNVHQSLLDGSCICRLAGVAGHAPHRRLHTCGAASSGIERRRAG